jgi:hypothetical protein
MQAEENRISAMGRVESSSMNRSHREKTEMVQKRNEEIELERRKQRIFGLLKT